MENASDKLAAAAVAHSIDLLRVEGGMRQKALATLTELEKSIAGKLLSAETLTSTQTQKYQKLKADVDASISATYKTIAKNQGKELEEIAKVEASAVKKQIGDAIGVDLKRGPMLTPERLQEVTREPNIFGHSSGKWWAKQDSDLRDKFQREMQQGILLGESVDQLSRRVRDKVATAEQLAGNSPLGGNLMKTAKRNADALVRSSVQTVANATRLKSFEDNTDLIKGVQWISTLDGRVTNICLALSGKVWSLPDYEPVGHDKAWPGPTAHFSCRSTQIAVLKDWQDLTKKKLKVLDKATIDAAIEKRQRKAGKSDAFIAEAKAKTRASMDGQVARDMTIDEFVKSKGEKFAGELLGKEKAKLFVAGKITTTDLTDQKNRPLRVGQLKASVETGKPAPETEGQTLFAYEPEAKDFKDVFADGKEAEKSAQDTADAVLLAQAEAAKRTAAAILADPEQKELAEALRQVQRSDPGLSPGEQIAKAEGFLEARKEAGLKLEKEKDRADILASENSDLKGSVEVLKAKNEQARIFEAVRGSDAGPDTRAAQREALAKLGEDNPDIVRTPPAKSDAPESGEHVIEFGDDRVIKYTKGEAYGFMPTSDWPDIQDFNKVALNIVPATPAQYIRRAELQNQIFNDDVKIIGVTKEGGLVQSQPRITGRAATREEIAEGFGGLGFVRVPNDATMLTGILSDTSWYHPEKKVWAVDVRADNVMVTSAGEMAVIDVMLTDSDEFLERLADGFARK